MILFGYNGILYADAVEEKKALEARIQEKFRRIEAALTNKESLSRSEE